jgi:hypothetical protein
MTNFNHKTASANFLRALGNGQSALRELDGIIQAVASDRNTGHFVTLLNKVEEKGDTVAAGMVRFIIGQVFKGSKLSRGKDKKISVIKVAGIDPDMDVVTKVSSAVSEGLSLRSNKLRSSILGETVKPKGEFNAKGKAEAVSKPLSVEELTALIAALSVTLKDKKEKAS